ncbi:LysM peptidoglycan-binding domain-containing protein, partial [bacterium]|nr:LysM peptidoglycan-binding domain-containing protein [bacterium]
PKAVDQKPLGEIIEANEQINFEAGQYEFNRALELIALGDIEEAKEKLNLIENLYPDSNHSPEARRILGEINLDEILSIENMENKRIYRVSPGEGYLKIATQNKTTLDSMMFLNGLTEFGNLHSGDELVIMSLDFKLLINLPKMRVELFYRDQKKKEHMFAKDYPIRKLELGRISRGHHQAKISRKHGYLKGKTYPPTHQSYRHASKVLGLKLGRSMIQLRPLSGDENMDSGSGVFLAPSDMEELSMLIRVGNEVEVRITR